ncbi:hypothetical protein [Chromohalobacter israelensis]|uniref:hypothetical protein n=1 Tax=Chromohalobacter israelensis TaxID=141390 RepID=UPI000D8A2D44|nr:hypothetical protein [Chromohalobacter salexigens]PWW33405.1 hypothetical protein DFO74_12641 [Chromohalobacter salexigens]
MPSKSFYRTYVAFYASYGYYDSRGDWVEGYTDPLFKKVNIQPFKDGEMLTFTEKAGFYNKGYKVVYFKGELVFPEDPPEDSEISLFYDGVWYQVQGSMDFTTPGRGPKHYKMLASKYATPPNIPEPTFPS